MLDDRIATADATCVTRLTDAGAVIVGKTNLTEFALMGYHPTRPIPINPWNAGSSTGGSSSGSGVAVAAGLCFAALGTDTGGSIRIPSSWCGTVGLKPTYGRVSRAGVFPLGASLDHIGPMARSVADAAHVLDALAGLDPRDPTTLRLPPPRCAAALGGDVRGVRIGWDEAYATTMVLPGVADAVYAAVDHSPASAPRSCACACRRSRRWSPRGRCSAAAMHWPRTPRLPQPRGAVRPLLPHLPRVRRQAHRRRLRRPPRATPRLGRRVRGDVRGVRRLRLPGTFMPPPPADALDPYGEFSDAIAPFMRFTAPFNFSGSPTLSIPCGFTDDALPQSLQLVAAHGAEATALSRRRRLRAHHRMAPPAAAARRLTADGRRTATA